MLLACTLLRKFAYSKFVKNTTMKKQLFFSLLWVFIAGVAAIAQSTSNLVVFSENGEKFILTIDGVTQNSSPQANVKATGLSGDFHRIGVQFEDKSLGIVNQDIALEGGTEQKAIVMLKKKGGYALRPYGEAVALSEVAAAPDVKMAAPQPSPSSPAQRATTSEMATPAVTTVTTTTTTTTTGDAENFKMDVGVGETKMGVDITIADGFGTMGTATTVKTEETTSVGSTTVYEEQFDTEPQPTSRMEVADNCGPMAGGDFATATKTISSKSFEDSKMTTAKQVLKANCMNTDQIIQVMNLFSFEESKIEFAKAAHEKCTDRQNYWKLNDAFTFESSIDELNDFLETK